MDHERGSILWSRKALNWRWTYFLIGAWSILPLNGQAQCGFDLGNDTVVCATGSLPISAPPGYLTYLWNTGVNTQSIVATASGQYICQVVQLDPATNLIVNGDMSAGSVGFTSGYDDSTGVGFVSVGGTFAVTTSPNLVHNSYPACPDHTTGTGNMLVVNGGPDATAAFWCQTIPVMPNSNYLLTYWLQNYFGGNGADVQVEINGVPVGSSFSTSNNGCGWEIAAVPWSSGAATSATICLHDLQTNDNGNDFSIDDISMIPFCYASDTINVLFQNYPTVNLGPNTTVCPGTPLLFDATQTGATYTWQDGSTMATMNAATAGTYWVEVNMNGCASADTLVVSNWPLPTVDLGPDLTLCAGESVMIGTTVAGATYAWNTGATSDSIQVSTSGNYWLQVTTNGCTVTDTINLTVIPLPIIALGVDTSICLNSQLLLDATIAGGMYVWSTGSILPDQLADPDSLYFVDVTVNGCSSRDSILITSHPLPIVALPADTSICPGEILALNAAISNGSYLWQDGTTTASYNASPGLVHVQVTDQNLCTNADSILIQTSPVAGIDLGSDTLICPEDMIMLDASYPAATYLWNDASTVPTLNASSGMYDVAVQLGNCTTYDTISIYFHIVDAVSLGNDTTLCPNELLFIDPAFNGDLVWQNGSTASTFLVTQFGAYWVEASDANSCYSSDSLIVNYASPNSISLGNDTSICTGSSLVLNASSPGASVFWDDGSSALTRTVTNAGIYSVLVTTGNCSTSDSIQVSLLPLPIVALGNDTTICPNSSLLLNATILGGSYLWQNGSTAAVVNAPAGITSVYVTDANGCSNSDAMNIGSLLVTPIDLGADLDLCNGDSVTLNAGNFSSNYVWNTASSSPSLVVNSAGTYWVSAMQGPCPVGDTVIVQILPIPVVSLGNDTTLCAGDTLVLDAATSIASSYLWQNGNTASTFTVSNAGTYHVSASTGSCTDQDTVVVNYLPLPFVDLGSDTSLCAGEGRMLDATTNNATYLWNNGSTAPDRWLVAGQSALVTVTVNGCSTTDQIIFQAIPLPTFDLGNDTMLCRNGSITLNGPSGMDAYQWSSGATTPSITISNTSGPTLMVQNNGCSFLDSISIGYVPLPAIDIGLDTVICPYQDLTLSTMIPNANIVWSTGASSPTITITAEDIYWVRATMLHCTETDTINVSVENINFPDLGPNLSTCSNDPIVLTVDPGAAQILWSDGTSGASILAQDSAQYWVQLTQNQCITSDSVVIEIIPLMDQLYLGPDVTICHDGETTLRAFVPTADYLWSTGETTANITTYQAGNYALHVTGYCIDAHDTISVAMIDCGPYIHIPNAFTPNGDGLNEEFGAVVDEPLAEFQLVIFDRWGQMIFESNDPHQFWDGKLNGSALPDGLFAWKLTFRRATEVGPKREVRFGHVTLLR